MQEMEQSSAGSALREAFRDSTRWEKAILETIPDPAWLKDTEGHFLAVNAAWCRMFGVEPNDALGKTVFDFLPAALARSLSEVDCRVVQSGNPMRVEEWLPDSAGRAVWFETIKTPLCDDRGDVVGTIGLARDITQRKRAEESLRESEERLKNIFNLPLVAVGIGDATGRIKEVNDAFVQLLGYSREELLSGAMKWTDLTPPEQAEMDQMNIAELKSTGKFGPCEKVKIRKDGTRVPILVGAARLPGPEHEHVAIIIDITQRKAHEREIERLNRLYAALSELNQIIVRVKSREDLFHEVCRIATQKAGFTFAWVGWVDHQTRQVVPIACGGTKLDYLAKIEVYADDRPEGRGSTGTSIREDRVCVVYDVLNDPNVAPWREAMAKCGFRTAASMPIRFHGSVVGALTAYDSELNVIRDKEIALLEEAAAAISHGLDALDHERERIRAEEALRESEERFRVLFEQSPYGILTFDPATARILQFNSAAHEQLGYSREEFSQLRILDIEAKDTAQEIADRVAVLIQTGKLDFETVHRTRQGEIRNVHVKVQVTDVNGRPIYQGIFRDITDEKRAQQEKLAMERRFYHAQKLESLGLMAGGIAHDFNNILAGIMGCTELVKRSLPPSEPAQADLDVIKRTVQQAAGLTRQMLAYSGKGRFVVEPVDLSRVVEDARKMLDFLVSRKALVKYNLATGLPSIQADAVQIHQVVLNLVVNAAEALADEGGTITVSTDTTSLSGADCAASKDGGELREGLYVQLEVADTGCGMDAETLAKIFDPFFTTKFTGRGLGLAAVHGIVRGHCGTIQIASKPGVGTTFRVLFPASGPTLPPQRTDPPAAASQASGKILVVADEEIVARLGN